MKAFPFENYTLKIEKKLNEALALANFQYKAVLDAVRYSLLNGGKRIRPILLLEFYKLCGKNDDNAYNFAIALEMIHTYSLIHDDLPCMDDDDFRRGKESCHKKFGEAIALLAGDALLTEAFNFASQTKGIDSELVLKSIRVLAENAGLAGMIGGQAIDITNSADIDIQLLLKMYAMKTSALIENACVCGALLAGADDNTVISAKLYAENLGIAFQIVDDILDFEGDEKLLGKPIGSDSKNDKKTVVTLLGIDGAKKLATQYTEKAISALQQINGDKESLIAITDYLLARKF